MLFLVFLARVCTRRAGSRSCWFSLGFSFESRCELASGSRFRIGLANEVANEVAPWRVPGRSPPERTFIEFELWSR